MKTKNKQVKCSDRKEWHTTSDILLHQTMQHSFVGGAICALKSKSNQRINKKKKKNKTFPQNGSSTYVDDYLQHIVIYY